MFRILILILFSALMALSKEDVYDESWALIVGIDKYDNIDNLDYAVEDAKSIRDLLINNFQFKKENIIFLLNEEAKYMKIKKSLSKITTTAVFYRIIRYFFATPLIRYFFATSVPKDNIERD